MKYEGKIYAKVAGKYIALVETAQDIDALKAENEKIKTNEAELARLVERWNGLAAENKRLRDGLNSMLNIEARDAIEELQEIHKIIEALNP